MAMYSFEGRSPRVDPTAFVAPTAVLIGARSMIAAHSLVVGGTPIPDEVLVTGSPAKVKGTIAGTGAEVWVNLNPKAYQDLAQRYRMGFHEILEI
ncbi:hypothetical protein [Mycolicibacterium sarraceniae]|uniref:Gamma carbonic anhydrase family protein n=1 Tax=Mycolicibacterium sarraceniae TaxID=1534348 RepID=A0A7I7SNV7_9MYCO|nr:hypothetical protein [Mycolicibacterium sarraceniae]BBY57909.1 hypothetical protein MSAR_10450 [Mycolicibacterium sarraceniae]